MDLYTFQELCYFNSNMIASLIKFYEILEKSLKLKPLHF